MNRGPGHQKSFRLSCLYSKTDQKPFKKAIIVCNGHYSIPAFADIVDIEKFKGTVIHSHDYRRNSAFSGRNVAVLGAAASGQDIGLEIAQVADKVPYPHRMFDTQIFYRTLREVG